MKTFKRNLIKSALKAGFAVAALGLAGTAMADPIDYIPPGTDYSFKFVNREAEVTQIDDELFGIFNVTQINSQDGNTTFWNGNGVTDGMQLVGYFENLTAEADQTGGGGLSFTGGNGAFFLIADGAYSPGTNPNTKDFVNQVCNGDCSTPWLTFDFSPGINDAIATSFNDPDADATIQAALATTNVQAGFGYMSVTGGSNKAFFDTDGFTFNNFDPADMFFRSNFVLANEQTCPSSNGWAVCSDDPMIGSTSTVPEPQNLVLLGIGLLGLTVSSLRKRKVN